jgi:hypothetical protein
VTTCADAGIRGRAWACENLPYFRFQYRSPVDRDIVCSIRGGLLLTSDPPVTSQLPAAEILRLLRGWREADRITREADRMTPDVVSPAADVSPTTLADLPAAIFRAYWNELSLDERQGANDPVKIRFGAWRGPGTHYLGALTADVLEGDPDDPHRLEKIIFAMKIEPQPTVEIFCQRTADTTQDEDMRRVAAFSASGVEFFVPVGGLPGSSPGGSSRFFSPNGRWCWNYQDDGHVVQYDTWDDRGVPYPSEAQWQPVWGNWEGIIRPLPWRTF